MLPSSFPSRYVSTERGRLLCWHLGAECYLETSSKTSSGVQELREAIFDALMGSKEGTRKRWRRAAKMVRM